MRNCTTSHCTTLTELERLRQIVDVDRPGQTAGARGRSRPPVVFDPHVVGGKHGVGEKSERQQGEYEPAPDHALSGRREMRSGLRAARRDRRRSAGSGRARRAHSRAPEWSRPWQESRPTRPRSSEPGVLARAAGRVRRASSEDLDRDDEAGDDQRRESPEHCGEIAFHRGAQRLAEPVERPCHQKEPRPARQRRQGDEQREIIAEQAARDRHQLVGDRGCALDEDHQPAPLGVGLLQAPPSSRRSRRG